MRVDLQQPQRIWWSRWLGDRGERAAARFLRQQGIKVLLRGYRSSRGEIDLVAIDGDTLVFVEVKTRRQGHPAEAVGHAKQRRLTHAAVTFLRHHEMIEQKHRFDVVAVVWPDAEREARAEQAAGFWLWFLILRWFRRPRTQPTIQHYRHAFQMIRSPSRR